MYAFPVQFHAGLRMVLLNVKQKSEAEQFLCSAPASTQVGAILKLCVQLQSKYQSLHRLCKVAEEIVGSHDASTCCETQPRGPLHLDKLDALCKSLSDSRQLLNYENVARKFCLTPALLCESASKLITAVSALSKEDGSTQASSLAAAVKEGELDSSTTTQLWFAGKLLSRDKLLQDYVGCNEKTKVVVRLQVAGDIKPPREPVLNEAMQKAMMAWHFKKQQELKELEAEDSEYTNSLWATADAFKKHLSGVDKVRLA